MNRQRRAALKLVMGQLEEIKALIGQAAEDLGAIKDEEQEALDNMPESLQEAERGQAMQEYIDTMDSVLDSLTDLDLDDLYGQIEEIAEG